MRTFIPGRRTRRSAIVLAADVAGAGASLSAALHLRLDAGAAHALLERYPLATPFFAATAAAVFLALRTYRRTWRFASLNDAVSLAAACAGAVLLYHGALYVLGAADWVPRSTPIIQWLVLLLILSGLRIARRLLSDYLRGAILPPTPSLPLPGATRPALLIGPVDEVELLLRQLERSARRPFQPVGILSPQHIGGEVNIRGVPILGSPDQLREIVERLEAKGERPRCILFAEQLERLRGAPMVRLVTDAQILGLEVSCLQGPVDFDPSERPVFDLRYIKPADLLGRTQTVIDVDPVARTISGRRVMVTGAGGTIGRELARQIARFKPASLLLLDANEFNLYEVDLEIRESFPALKREALLCSIRQRPQLMQVFDQHRPELVFHAAALKHVPLVEAHPSAGVQTNVIGTQNVVDAASRFGALAMVQVSTDKAVNPVGFMGVTKRLGELYCQAVDLAEADRPQAARFMTVRFGNVLGSSGSLIPLFQRQLSNGGPLTVTHPEIERFFMTVHEAVQLVLHAAARGLEKGAQRGRVFVLDMGEPIRVMDIAKRMIRLAGLEPGDDIQIDIVGLRPGEKLFEELFDSEETRLPATCPGILEAESRPLPLAYLAERFRALERASAAGNDAQCRAVARAILEHTKQQDQEVISFQSGRAPIALLQPRHG